MTLAELRRAAEALPAGAGLTLSREAALELVVTMTTATTYTVGTLASLLHRSPSTVRGWLEACLFPGAYQLPGSKRPGAWRIPQSAVEAFGARGAKPSRQDAPGAMGATRAGTGVHRGPAPLPVDLGAWRKLPTKED